MSSQIGNQDLLRAIGQALDIESVKQAPSRLNTAEIVAALMLHTGFANYEKWALPNISAVSCAGQTEIDATIIAQNPLFPNVFMANSQGREVVILGYRLDVDYTAGGAAIDANVPLGLATYFYDPDGTLVSTAGMLETWAIVVASRLNYSFSFPYWGKQHSNYFTSVSHGQNRIWVPAGSEYGIRVQRGGAGFAAGTTYQLKAFGISVPKGVCPPLCG